MGVETKIQWTNHTFNGVRGCTKVSAGCANCYAEKSALRNPKIFGRWGVNGTRVAASDAMWKEPLKWNKAAQEAGEIRRVFAYSLADVFEAWDGPILDSHEQPLYTGYSVGWHAESEIVQGKGWRPVTMENVRRRLARLIWETPSLEWLLLTKRPENAADMTYRMWFPDAEWPKNYMIGTSVENQEVANARLPILVATPCPGRFISMEPLLGPVDLTNLAGGQNMLATIDVTPGPDGTGIQTPCKPSIDWVIIGGESGHNARSCNVAWIRSLKEQCEDTGTAVFVKQWGSKPYWVDDKGFARPIHLKDSHGGDWEEWPYEFHVREFPNPRP